jgi:tRNA threonylcarbamoyladenosine biosynthesis protein TsaB
MAARILHIDTSGSRALVMLAEDGIPKSRRSSDTERDHAARLLPLVDEVLSEANCPLPELDAIAVCSGPGSYTGLRIGLATAKGYCYALGKPLLLHNRLTLMLGELEAMPEAGAANKLAILPARAGEYYVASSGESVMAPQHMMLRELEVLAKRLTGPADVIGTVGDDLKFLNTSILVSHSTLNAEVWARASMHSFSMGSFADLAYAEPEYLKSAYVIASRKEK